MSATLILIGVIAAIVIVDRIVRRHRVRRLLLERAGHSICEYARAFPKLERDPLVLRAVYNHVGMWMLGDPDGFPARPSDDIARVYELPMDELDEDLPELAVLAGRSLTDTNVNPYYRRVRTVGDLVRFLLAQPTIGAA